MTAALKIICADRPGFVVDPCPPHAHVLTGLKGLIHQTSGHAFADACRARLGPMAWSQLERGVAYQHNVRAVWHPVALPKTYKNTTKSRLKKLRERERETSF